MLNILEFVPMSDGAHCGLDDRYPAVEMALEKALSLEEDWTTGWYSSKKAIASAKITHEDGVITVEVSVTDDLDSEGLGSCIATEKTIESIDEAIAKAWELAEADQEENQDYTGFSIISSIGWIETYIQQRNDGWEMDEPPGDCYHQWGFQDESDDLTDADKESIRNVINENNWETNKKVTVGNYRVEVLS